jgi:energy-coupling factor transporter ATP-binding protein EcfA2
MLRFENLWLSYQSDTETSSILEEVSFSFAPGDQIGILGGNGSGKSTIARLCQGLLQPDQGRVFLESNEPSQFGDSLQKQVGLLQQNPAHQMIHPTLADDLAFGLENQGTPSAEIQASLLTWARRLDLEAVLESPIAELSSGMQALCALAGILMTVPRYLVLDEPYSRLDPWTRGRFRQLLHDLTTSGSIGLLLLSHTPEDLEGCSTILVLHERRIVFSGSPGALWANPKLPEWGFSPPDSFHVATLGGCP